MAPKAAKQITKDWEKRYAEEDTPWEDDEPSPEMMQLFTHFVKPGASVLEIGCGLGVNACWLAEKGFQYFGVDIAETAVHEARQRLGKQKLPGTIWQADIMSEAPERQFDVVFDKGCFHTWLKEKDRVAFASTIHKLIEPRGLWVSISGSLDNEDEELAEECGYPRMSAEEIVRVVEKEFMIHYLTRCYYGTTPELTDFLGWACVLQRR